MKGRQGQLKHGVTEKPRRQKPNRLIIVWDMSVWYGLPRCFSGKEPACQCRRHKRLGFDPWVRKIPWRRKWYHTSVFLPGKSHGQGSLAGYSPWGSRSVGRNLVTEQECNLCVKQAHSPLDIQRFTIHIHLVSVSSKQITLKSDVWCIEKFVTILDMFGWAGHAIGHKYCLALSQE